jgi:DNA-binding NarL/FixJ family response regulator
MRTILLIEHCEYAAVPLEIALTCLDGMRVLRASNASEACELLFCSHNQIAALITDLYLPQMDGFEFIELVRRTCRSVHLPILVVTGDDRPDTPHRLFHLGADAYFLKPFSLVAVRQKLRSLLETRP